MAANQQPLLVIGAGVIGLTTALRLAEAGLPVRVLADEPPARTTSAAAGAMWEPYLTEHPDMDRWSRVTYERLLAEADDPRTGVRVVRGVEATRDRIDVPDWARELPEHTEVDPGTLPPGFATGWGFTTALIDMPVYLARLAERLERHGVRIERAHVTDVTSLTGTAPVVVNCTGHRAAQLLGDEAVEPIRGQLVAVRNPGITEFFCEHTDDPTAVIYLLPHGDTLILGGSAEKGYERPEPDPRITREILQRAVALFPALAGAEVLGERVGFRPYRAPVRVEAEGRVIHNYGHGGAGVTLSWGSAGDVVAMAWEIIGRR
ncbi:putative D-amino-acid oxidase [Actinoplanes ianthinogenes]|uniref:D-amino-acid oxidase n=1 Tax=Actinoplanes ianthinogenes TaxID=122358 RepID=A0ABN6CAM9_9ACTN|nr:FAD-dependent oxidoreductase [Actinoplanes ianthinogenes]BCJ42332.1 putative D-amino-acid oxidase [Actinoplanes ianthinogenes]GGR57596.1 putative D-amino-acid oxidase [Actinoplanes ianthinogenes]